jgi:hypothetical protein
MNGKFVFIVWGGQSSARSEHTWSWIDMNLNLLKQAAVGLVVAGAALSAQAYEISVNVAGIESRGEFGAAGNQTRVIDLFEGARITAIAWNVDLSANTPSWLSELSVDFGDGAGAGVALSPGVGDDVSGDASYGGSFELGSLSFVVGASGQLFLEFFEIFDDFAGADGVWRSGTLTVTYVPEPATFGLAAIALLGLGAASRRRQAQR